MPALIAVEQVPKHLGKVNGEPVFGALHTATNEYVEVRQMHLTPTKSHDQFMPGLAKIPQSLTLYGHGEIEAIMTDNVRADKGELERMFPSLRKDVHPVPLQTTLPPLKIPLDWNDTLLDTVYLINDRLNEFLEHIQSLPGNNYVDVAMDMEWSVNRQEHVHGRVSLVSIAFSGSIYLIRVRI